MSVTGINDQGLWYANSTKWMQKYLLTNLKYLHPLIKQDFKCHITTTYLTFKTCHIMYFYTINISFSYHFYLFLSFYIIKNAVY